MIRHIPATLITWFCSALLVCGALTLAACASHHVRRLNMKADLLILHANDTHSYIAGIDEDGYPCTNDSLCKGGLARMAAAIKEAKAQGDNVLALDAGDMFTGTVFYSVSKWPLLAKVNELMPWDAATLGNHEWDEGCTQLAAYLAAKRPFPMLAANLKPEKNCPLLHSDTPPYTVREIGGHKVGVIGLCNDEVLGISSACPKTKFIDRLNTVRTVVRELEDQGVKRIVLLTHIGLPADRQLARSVDGVDIIVGGHTHSYLGPGSKDGPYPVVEKSPSGHPVLVVTAKWATQYLGVLACNFDRDGLLTSWSGQARELVPSDPRDSKLSAMVAKHAAALNVYRAQKVGHLDYAPGPDGLEGCRAHECPTGDIMTDAMLNYGLRYGAHMALLNSGAVRAAIPAGDISRGDVLTAFPFGTRIQVREYTGKQVWEALEHGMAGEGARGPQTLQTAGLRYVVDTSRPSGKRILKAEAVDKNGYAMPLRPREWYRVVVTSFLSQGWDYFHMLTKGRVVTSPEPKDVDVLYDYLAGHSPLPPPFTGRIVRK
ncbi:MAG: bifunctional metallophosphatase/5'-nucleotidase [Desulfovibrio sp.]|nr:bifunctional metallophosphatase/5'-nucleotidase [Desulfovibrio sp.]